LAKFDFLDILVLDLDASDTKSEHYLPVADIVWHKLDHADQHNHMVFSLESYQDPNFHSIAVSLNQNLNLFFHLDYGIWSTLIAKEGFSWTNHVETESAYPKENLPRLDPT
jgi:hypothetical protein